MFDLRYHVASLAAIFLALAIGIILGVAISGKVRGAESSFAASERDRLRAQLAAERDAGEADRTRLASLETFVERSYMPLIEDRLRGESFAVVFLGPVDDDLQGEIARTLQDAGAGGPARLVAFDVPVDPKGLDDYLHSHEGLTHYAGDDFGNLGRRLGAELGGGAADNPVVNQVSSALVEEQSGSITRNVDGVVVARTWQPDGNGTRAERKATESLFDGVVSGLQGAGVPAVGVTRTESSGMQASLEAYGSAGLSSVNDVDFPSGRLALALLLEGAEPGDYGFGDETDGPIPSFPPAGAP